MGGKITVRRALVSTQTSGFVDASQNAGDFLIRPPQGPGNHLQ
jgi:hypothetical protein